MGKVVDITGQVFGRLTAIRRIGQKHNNAIWECLCVCGNICTVNKGHLGQDTNSCGCLRKELSGQRLRKHGLKKSIEYEVWTWMKSRCLNPHNKRYRDYGGRGIRVCERWSNSFENFLQDMGPRPTSSHSIDRIDNSGDYAPENCRWATRFEQVYNRRNNVKITLDGVTMSPLGWSERTGIKIPTIMYRLKQNWTPHEALTRPVIARRRR